MYCRNCGEELPDKVLFCTKCGAPTEEKRLKTESPLKPKWVPGRTLAGSLSLVLSVLVMFQSLAVGLGNTLTRSSEGSGAAGIVVAVLMFTAGLTGLITRKTVHAGSPYACCVIYWFCFFLSRVGSGSFADLRVWGLLDFLFGCIFLFSAQKTKKGYLIAGTASAIYLILGLI